eukprot:gnl/TRDRNA2_/TRDRNA2_154134_c0_seq1.p1 gnl/TRDRNA2_/TRDRNA2_154134_c0~~gnl/TRDRNA2_/TRDRNA2_154134_c0_seq1.p1  ORF type:complete len:693 (+),score=112.26 gnl/TRDRNA2_/TRDRNA2_154134_c0_seq1:64-2142(+)
MAADASARPPSFDHLDFDDKGSSKWAQHMAGLAERLSSTLYSTRDSWGRCIICDVDYPLNMNSHITGQKHAKLLKAKLNYRPPQSYEELCTYDQYWDLKPGASSPYYRFNHVTGDQGFSGPPQAGPPTAAPAAYPSAAYPSAVSSNSAPAPALQPELVAPSGAQPDRSAAEYQQAVNEKGAWRRWMDQPSSRLEEVLHKATGSWGGRCVVCDAEMGRGAHDHLQSQNHWRAVWNKLNGKPPLFSEAGGLDRPWVQTYETSAGSYAFNHLTGEQGFTRGPAGAPAAPPTAATGPPAAQQPIDSQAAAPPAVASGPPAAQQPLGAVYSPAQAPADPWEELTQHPTTVLQQQPPAQGYDPTTVLQQQPPAQGYDPTTVLQQQPPAQCYAVAAAVEPPTPSTAIALSTPPSSSTSSTVSSALFGIVMAPHDEYHPAMQKKETWRAYMEPRAKHLENVLWTGANLWGGMCPVCSADMSRGIGDHLASQNHWKGLWKKVSNRVPEPTVAHEWTRQWVQTFETPRGSYLFNHLTGGQGLQAEVLAAPPPEAGAVAAPAAAPQQNGIAGGQEPPRQEERFDLAFWVWRRHIQDCACKLQRAVEEHVFTPNARTTHLVCAACSKPMDDGNGNVSEHIMSASHFKQLQGRITAPPDDKLTSGPWVQEITCSQRGSVLRFNHLTGELQVPQQQEKRDNGYSYM